MSMGDKDEEVRVESESRSSPEQDTEKENTPPNLPQHQYDRNTLNLLSLSPAAMSWPDFLDKEYANDEGCWDPEKWFRGASPVQMDPSERKKPPAIDVPPVRKRSIADPKERLKEDRDGIVLSPQRRSFGTGCHVTQSTVARQQSCPADFREGNDRDRREQRRIGSGRIQIDREQPREREREFHRERFDRDQRDRDSRDRDIRDRDHRDRDIRDRDPRDIRDRDPRDRRYDERYSRDNDRRREYRGYGRRGRDYRHEEEAPEWFTEGPMSQTDTIELRGFDCVEETEEETATQEPITRQSLQPNKDSKKQNDICVTDRNGSLETNESSSPEADHQPVSNHMITHHQIRRSPAPQSSPFDFNEFFNIENIPGLVDGSSPESEIRNMGSRFSQWFQAVESHGNSRHNSRRSSINEEFTYLNEMISGSRSPMVPSPHSLVDKSFSPGPDERNTQHHDVNRSQKSAVHPMVSALIAHNQQEKPSHSQTSSPLSASDAEAQLKALILGKLGSTSSSERSTPGMSPLNLPPKAKTVAELEADMRTDNLQHGPINHASHQSHRPHPHTDQAPPRTDTADSSNDLAAFNKLLTMMRAGVANAESPPPKLQAPVAMRPDNRPPSPVYMNQPPKQMISTAAQNEFLQAILRNKEKQRLLQQQAQYRYQQHSNQPPPAMISQGGNPGMSHPSQQMSHQLIRPQPQQPSNNPPSFSTHHHSVPSHPPDPIMSFIKQNPTIITKPASPSPTPPLPNLLAQSTTPRSPSPQVIQQQLLSSQQSTPRIQSPIMFSQQPPRHLSAPSPVHPAQLSAPSPVHGLQLSAPSPVHGVQLSAPSPVHPHQLGQNTLSATSNSIRPPSVPRVPSPQELIAHTQAIMQNALIKKQLEDQKERFMRKQHDGSKSPNPLMMIPGQVKPPPGVMAAFPTSQVSIQSPTATKPSMTMAFTPTSVMRRMHSEKVEKEEKMAKGDTPTSSNQGSPSHHARHLEDDARRLENGLESSLGSPNSHPTMKDLSEQQQHHRNLQYSMAQMPPNSYSNPVMSIAHQQQIAAALKANQEKLSRAAMVQGHSLGQAPNHSVPNQGRPILKGQSIAPTSTTPANMGMRGPHLPGGMDMTGQNHVNMDVAKLLEQQRLQQQQHRHLNPAPMQRGSANPYSVSPLPGRLPLQPGMVPASVGVPPNPLVVQQLMQGGMSPAIRGNLNTMTQLNQINQLNQLNKLNQLAVLQAQQKSVDPRLQVRGGYPGNILNPRSPVPPGAVNPALGRALSPNIQAQSLGIHGQMSPSGFPPNLQYPGAGFVGMNGNNNPLGKTEDAQSSNLAKWFGMDVFKNQLPNMPVLPHQGQKVLTVDEIERSQH